jgi:hypothetical protein
VSRTRQPLGLAPIDDDREERASADDPVAEIAAGIESAIEALGGRAATKASKATTLDMIQTLGEALTATVQGDGVLYDLILTERKRTAALEGKVEALTIQLAEMRGAFAERSRATILRP